MKIFRHDDKGYLEWVADNTNGYVVNIDEPNSFTQYPMVHKATHKLISSSSRRNYTTAQYFKVCSINLDELETWSLKTYGKKLTKCKTCM